MPDYKKNYNSHQLIIKSTNQHIN